MISDEVYVEIKVLRKQGLSLRQIASEVGYAVNTVRAHLSTPELPRYERKAKLPSKLPPFETYLRERQAAAHPDWIPASVLYREIVAQGYAGGGSQLRAFMHALKPTVPNEPVIRFETESGAQMQVDWVEFRKGQRPLYAFCATLGYSRASYVEFVSDMKVTTLIACHESTLNAAGQLQMTVERQIDGHAVKIEFVEDEWGELRAAQRTQRGWPGHRIQRLCASSRFPGLRRMGVCRRRFCQHRCRAACRALSRL